MIDFKALFEHSPNAYMLLDRSLRYVAANPAYLRLTASRLEELLGRTVFEVFPHDPVHPDNPSARQLRASFDRVLQTRRPDTLALIRYRVPRQTDAGKVVDEDRFWSATHTPLLDDRGEVRFLLQHTTDVTELQELKETVNRLTSSREQADLQLHAGVLHRARLVQEENLTLEEERQFLRGLFEQAPGFIAVLRGRQHVFELVNEAYYEVVGTRALIGKAVREALPEVEGQGFFELLDRVFEAGQPFVGRGMPARLARRDGALEEVFVDLVYQPILDGTGKVSGIFVQGHDVTEQHRVQQELARYRDHLEELVRERTWALEESEAERRRAEEELRQAQKMEAVGKLTGGVAHDFNNLLQVIGGNLQLLQKELGKSSRAAQRLKNANDAVSRGGKLAAQLLAFARRQPLQPVALNLGTVLRRMDDLVTRAVGEHIAVQVRVEPELWNTRVDPNQLENVILNLVLNARDAMKGEGRLLLEVHNAQVGPGRRELAPGDYAVLSVTDDGCGMPPDVAEHAFEPFFTTKPIGQGSGLGLSTVYGFVKQSGGHVELESAPGRGTTLRIYLPRTDQREERAVEVQEAAALPGHETVLVVEDDPPVRATVVATLRDLGYRVLEASEGQGALALLHQGAKVDLLFSDVVMPGPVRTTELLRQARALLPDLEVLFTSGYTQETMGQDGALPPGVTLLGKPYTREQLAAKLRELLERREGTAAGAQASRLRLLLVEDNADIRTAVAEVLRELGHQVTEADTAEAARLALGDGSFDVLFTDVKLPTASGLDLAREALQRQPQLRVILATGDTAAQRRWEEQGLPNAVMLPKPFDLDEIARAIQRVRA